jgi:hypothetical protein
MSIWRLTRRYRIDAINAVVERSTMIPHPSIKVVATAVCVQTYRSACLWRTRQTFPEVRIADRAIPLRPGTP